MTHLLSNFDRDKTDLFRRIAASPGIEAAVKLTDGYLSGLHSEMTGRHPLQKSRYAGRLLEILRYGVRTLETVDTEVRQADSLPLETRSRSISKRFFLFVKTVQLALVLALLMTLQSVVSTPWTPVLLVLILLGTEVYLHVFTWKGSVPWKTSDGHKPDETPQVDVQLKIAHVHAYLNCIADALSCIDKALNEQTPEKEGGFLENQTQILKLFQDLFEARAFHDGEWALKKISRIQAILWEQGIAVKEFDPADLADIASFDVEPGPDPAFSSHVTLRPAFIKNNRVLLRGRVAAPYSFAQNQSAGP
jgi:hypothetical protein